MYLAGGFKYVLFSPLPGEMTNIFQMGWNHQVLYNYVRINQVKL